MLGICKNIPPERNWYHTIGHIKALGFQLVSLVQVYLFDNLILIPSFHANHHFKYWFYFDTEVCNYNIFIKQHYNLNLPTNSFSSSAKVARCSELPATSSIELLDCCADAAVSSTPAADSSETEAISSIELFIF